MEELEAKLSGKIQEIQLEVEDGKPTKTFGKQLQGSQVHRNHEDAALHCQIVKPVIKLIDKDSDVENLEAILYVRVKDLEKQLQ